MVFGAQPILIHVCQELCVVLRASIMVEGGLALGAEGKIVEPVLGDAVFGPAVETLYDEFIQGKSAPAADRPVFQSTPYDAIFLSAPETTDNKVILKHLDSCVCLLADGFYTIQYIHRLTAVWRFLWCLPFPGYREGGYILQGVHPRLLWPTW